MGIYQGKKKLRSFRRQPLKVWTVRCGPINGKTSVGLLMGKQRPFINQEKDGKQVYSDMGHVDG